MHPDEEVAGGDTMGYDSPYQQPSTPPQRSTTTMKNTLYYGDNLDVLRDFPAEFVDLVYLDPPFNSSRSYNVLFKDESGHEADAQITAFEDTWHWNHHTEHLYNQLVTQADEPVSR